MKMYDDSGLTGNVDPEKKRVAQAIIDMLAQRDIKLELKDVVVGATFTRYVYSVLSLKTRMSEFRALSDEIAGCALTNREIMIHAPLRGTQYLGIDVANTERRIVSLPVLLDSDKFKSAQGELNFVMGEDVYGNLVVADLVKLPHLLIAGSTGSGKSEFINSLVISMIYKYGPDHVRFVLVDPKGVELSVYNGSSHLLIPQTVTEVKSALASLDYLIEEMERRYALFRQCSVVSLREYNAKAESLSQTPLPYLVFVADEFADIMAVNKKEFEVKLIRLAQKSRGAGIHVVLATQRVDLSVISGSIKAVVPSRVAFRVCSVYDSQIVLGSGGADKLLGYGDMLFMDVDSPNLSRLQGAYVSMEDIRAIVYNSSQIDGVSYDPQVRARISALRKAQSADDEDPVDDLYPLYKKALRFWLVNNDGRASISSIQRGLNIGFNRAGRVMDKLQQMGYVENPPNYEYGVRPLMVLVTLEELDNLFPDTDDD